MGLREYRGKRRFDRTPEPRGKKVARARRAKSGALSFCVQKHAASRLHYDFRLEHAGVLMSWAVPKGPSLDPKDKRLAVQVEDHPLDYGGFEGIIPKGEYGGGPVLLWDRGTWEPDGDVVAGLRKGHLAFRLFGEKLAGGWSLVRIRGAGEDDGKNWLLIKRPDEAAKRDRSPITARAAASVLTGRTIDEIAADAGSAIHTSRAPTARRAPTAPTAAPRAKRASAAIATPLPEFIEPELATLVDAPPTGDEWVHEIRSEEHTSELQSQR